MYPVHCVHIPQLISTLLNIVPYTRKVSRGKTFVVGIENDHSWENVRGSGFTIHCKILWLGKDRTMKVFLLETFLVFGIL